MTALPDELGGLVSAFHGTFSAFAAIAMTSFLEPRPPNTKIAPRRRPPRARPSPRGWRRIRGAYGRRRQRSQCGTRLAATLTIGAVAYLASARHYVPNGGTMRVRLIQVGLGGWGFDWAKSVVPDRRGRGGRRLRRWRPGARKRRRGPSRRRAETSCSGPRDRDRDRRGRRDPRRSSDNCPQGDRRRRASGPASTSSWKSRSPPRLRKRASSSRWHGRPGAS